MAAPAINYLILLAILLSSLAFGGENYCYFTPPQTWELAHPGKLASTVRIGFIGRGSSELCPSLNLAAEAADVSMEKYIKAVKKIHAADRKNRWRDLGNFAIPAGPAHLIEIDTTSEWGPVRMMQMIVLKDGMAYILTGAALKEEFNRYAQDFKKAFASLTFTSDLVATVPQAERREKLMNKIAHLKTEKTDWQNFQASILHDFTDMGPHWQILLLQSVGGQRGK